MSDKKNKKTITMELLCKELDDITKTGKVDINRYADIFGRINDVKDAKNDEIERLFYNIIKVADKKSWEFLFEIYSRFYNRNKLKKHFLIIDLIYREIEHRMSDVILPKTMSDLDSFVVNGDIREFEYICDAIEEYCNKRNALKCEYVAYLYIYLLMRTNKMCPGNINEMVKIERVFFVKFAKENKDFLFVKNVKKAFLDGKYEKKFKELTYIYEDIDREFSCLKNENSVQKQVIYDKNVRIKELEENNDKLEEDIRKKSCELKSKSERISELEALVTKTDNRNEYNENMYKQQFITLKHSFVEKLKKDLKLEMEGLEDIADNFEDAQKNKIYRRIDRIYKILCKAGE